MDPVYSGISKGWFLYVVSESQVFRLKLDAAKLSNRESIPPGKYDSPPVPLEKVRVLSDYGEDDENGNGIIPMFMKTLRRDHAHMYLVGGFGRHPPIANLPNLPYAYLVAPRVPVVNCILGPFNIPSSAPSNYFLVEAMTNRNVHMFQSGFSSKLYFLDLIDSERMAFYVIDDILVHIQRFLPNPPIPAPYEVVNQTGWENKIHIHVSPTESSIPYIAYTFDMCQETWKGGMDQVLAAVKYKDFLIALLESGMLVSYGSDSDGYPIGSHTVLFNMFDICMLNWLPHFDAQQAFMGTYFGEDGDFIWLTYKVRDCFHMLFVLFRVSIEEDCDGEPVLGSDGKPILSVVVEASHQYDNVDLYMCNAFACIC